METSYKEKYEQALAKAKEQYNYPCMRSCMGILEEIFPELAESEDEKMMKEIIELVMQPIWKTEKEFYRRNELCAWLKKQGEHANFLSKIQVGDKVTRNEDGVLVNLSQLKRVAKPREKQCEQKFEIKTAEESLGVDSETYNKIVDECIFGEQKPADKVEPKFKVGDKIYLKPEYRMPNDDTPIANTVKEIRRIDDKHYRFDGSYIFIEDQDKYELVEQKPAWSEEDERLCQCLIEDQEEALDNVRNDKYGHSEIISDLKEMYHERIDWLKSLKGRVQPKQEWNEEDEQHIDSLLKRLDALCRNKFERTRFAISEDRYWLKSLKERIGGKV